MWCVVYAGEGREQKTEEFIRGRLPESACGRCFHLVQRFIYRRQGKATEAAKNCFPGYVFIETNEPETVQKLLKNTRKSILFSDSNFVSAIDGEEEALLERLCDQSGEIGLSVARVLVDAGSGRKEVKFLSGPLSRVADKVVQVDFHRRCARLGGRFPGKKASLTLGFCYEGEEPEDSRKRVDE